MLFISIRPMESFLFQVRHEVYGQSVLVRAFECSRACRPLEYQGCLPLRRSISLERAEPPGRGPALVCCRQCGFEARKAPGDGRVQAVQDCGAVGGHGVFSLLKSPGEPRNAHRRDWGAPCQGFKRQRPLIGGGAKPPLLVHKTGPVGAARSANLSNYAQVTPL